MSRLGISTAWLATKVEGAEQILQAVEELGLGCLEVDYRVTRAVVLGLKEAVHKGRVCVTSVHNPAPLPEWMDQSQASGDALKLSSLDEEERRGAVELAVGSVRLAAELGARVVVFHLGEVEFEHDADRFFEFFRQGKIGEPEVEDFRRRKLAERKKHRDPYLNAVLRSLSEIHPEAEKHGVWLGIENRYRYHQIPDIDEFEILFREFEGGRVGYWHDTGHAQVFQALGFWQQDEPLRRYGEHLLGFHLHDCRGIDDHRAPGDGDIDWQLLRPYLERSEILAVMEIHPKVSAAQAKRGMEFLRALGLDREDEAKKRA